MAGQRDERMIASTQTNHPLLGNGKSGARALSPIELATTKLKSAGLRITQPRLAILAALSNRPAPTSIEQLHVDVGPDNCDLVTVYRCLAAFEELGMVRRSYLHNGTCLYEVTLHTQRHYHIICKSCDATDRVDYFPVEGIERLLQDRGYTQVSHVVEFFGVCLKCQSVTRQAIPALPGTRA